MLSWVARREAAGLSSTFVVNGSPTKTAMVDGARSRTQVAQLTTAACVALVLLFLTEPLQYLPNAVLAWGEPYDSPLWDQRREGLAYVCRQYTCQAPQDTLEGLMAQLDEPRPAAADA